MTSDWRTIALDRGDHGVRVDRVLLRHLRDAKGVSRNRIQKWIDAGDVLINGSAPPRAAWRVQPGDDVRVRVADLPKRERPRAEVLPIDVLYEDDDLLAVNKPAGQVVHPSFRNTSGTLINEAARARALAGRAVRPGAGGPPRQAHIGVVLVAKRADIHAALQRAMAARRIDRTISPSCAASPPRREAPSTLPWTATRGIDGASR